ncbi:Na(+)/H(+) antiporter subunit B [Gilvimarinus sp. F26214L]|uniref:Na(+)/H(+) antiporter subunit B n=1 Tax=Gilvimarinus sp. DZF01 TaxID=3461371 RepID=UPI0040451CF3
MDVTLLTLLMVTALAIAFSKDLFAAVMLAGIYGLLSASFFVAMDAVDVAFTEAAVGAGISPLLMLATLALSGRFQAKNPGRFYLLALVLVVAVGSLLMIGTSDMPGFGDPEAPAQQHVAPRYIEQSGEEVGVPNIVTSVLASYRGFDTLGETAVIFTAGLAVLSLLAGATRTAEGSRRPSMVEHKVLRIVSKILIPPILIFALYVQFHGDYGPGGGFQAGVIFAAAIILYSMLFGLDVARRVINESLVQILAAVGVLLYGCVGIVSMLNGKNFLDYSGLATDPIAGQHIGIILIELGVGITVASVMILVFFAFAGQMSDGERN